MLALGLSMVRRAMEAVRCRCDGHGGGRVPAIRLDLVFAIRDESGSPRDGAAFVAISASQRLQRLVPPLSAPRRRDRQIVVLGNSWRRRRTVALAPEFLRAAFSCGRWSNWSCRLRSRARGANGQGITVAALRRSLAAVDAIALRAAPVLSSRRSSDRSRLLTGP